MISGRFSAQMLTEFKVRSMIDAHHSSHCLLLAAGKLLTASGEKRREGRSQMRGYSNLANMFRHELSLYIKMDRATIPVGEAKTLELTGCGKSHEPVSLILTQRT